MIPTMILVGLVLGRWWRAALIAAAVVWPLMLVVSSVVDGMAPPSGPTLIAAAAFGAANAAVGVAVHQGLLWVTRRTWRLARRAHA